MEPQRIIKSELLRPNPSNARSSLPSGLEVLVVQFNRDQEGSAVIVAGHMRAIAMAELGMDVIASDGETGRKYKLRRDKTAATWSIVEEIEPAAKAALEVIDFSKCPTGTLVQRSAHWLTQHGNPIEITAAMVRERANKDDSSLTAAKEALVGERKKQLDAIPGARQIGMIVDRSFIQDAEGQVICWPFVHWEDEPMAYLCHPVNLAPYRDLKLPTITMVEGA